MNIYDFDKTIYNGDSTADFYFFALKKHKKIITLVPSLLGAFLKYYVFKRGTKTDFKEIMYRFLQYCDVQTDVQEFWKTKRFKIKKFYLENQRKDDVIISASPEFLLKPICSELGINHLIASCVDEKTGKYSGINCHGKEKVRRFYESFDKSSEIEEFYSDSYSDTPLAELAKKAYLVKQDKLLDWNFDR